MNNFNRLLIENYENNVNIHYEEKDKESNNEEIVLENDKNIYDGLNKWILKI